MSKPNKIDGELLTQAIEEIWKFYQLTLNKPDLFFTEKRKEKGLSRLRDAMRMPEAKGNLASAVELMKAAIEEVARDPWEGRSSYNDWEKHIFGSTERFESWIEKWRKGREQEDALNHRSVLDD